jgi:protein-S-isoprenylcysteine O-methyltransferase Ste14
VNQGIMTSYVEKCFWARLQKNRLSDASQQVKIRSWIFRTTRAIVRRGMDLQKFVFRYRGALMAPPLVFAAICTWHETENEFLVFGLGGVLFSCGMLLRLWSQMHLHYRLKIPKALTITGPYVYVRNPVYIANTVMLVATVILAELFWFAPVMFVYCMAVYTVVVRFEESHLLNKYGQAYADYAGKTSRWIPNFHIIKSVVAVDTKRFFVPSLLAEAPSFLLLLPFLIKELVCVSA